jgi:hypothetical protein
MCFDQHGSTYCDAPFIRQAYEEMATGNYTQEEIRKRLNSKGFVCSKNLF